MTRRIRHGRLTHGNPGVTFHFVLEVKINVSSKEFKGRYYHNISAWEIESVGETQPLNDNDANDLPF